MIIPCHFGIEFFVSPLKGVKRGIKFVCISFAFKFIYSTFAFCYWTIYYWTITNTSIKI